MARDHTVVLAMLPLIRLADEAMYQSKRAGGNGVRRRHVDRLGAP